MRDTDDISLLMRYTGKCGPDGLPDPGNLTRYLRKTRQMSQARLASELKVSRAMVTRMELEGLGMDSMITRRNLARVLGVSPLLFGVPTKSDFKHLVLYDTTILQKALQLHRDLYFSGGNVGGVPEAEQMIQSIHQISQSLDHNDREVLTILCHYAQLGIDIAREEQDYPAAERFGSLSTTIAARLDNPVLLVTTFMRLSSAMYESGAFERAKAYADRALSEITPKEKTVFDSKPKVSTNVVGVLCLDVAGAYAALSEPDALKYITHGTTIACRGIKEEDVGFLRLTLGYCHMRNARVLIAQGEYEAALDILDDADDATTPNFIRRKCTIQRLRACAYLKLQRCDYSAQSAQSALSFATTMNSNIDLAYVTAIYRELKNTFGNAEEVVNLRNALKPVVQGKKLQLPQRV